MYTQFNTIEAKSIAPSDEAQLICGHNYTTKNNTVESYRREVVAIAVKWKHVWASRTQQVFRLLGPLARSSVRLHVSCQIASLGRGVVAQRAGVRLLSAVLPHVYR